MENLKVDLDEIISKLQKLKIDRRRLKAENNQLEVQLNLLKVEVDHYKTEYTNLKKEKEELVGKVNNPLSSNKGDSTDIEVNTVQQKSVDTLKLQLDEFIENIDQCIQIIQAK